MMSNLQTTSLLCNLNEVQTNTILVVIFIISFFFFRHISNKSPISDETKKMKIQKAKKYLERHQEEDAAFFMS